MKSKKLIASLLMVVFMFSILPTVAFAKEVEKSSFEQDFLSYFQEVMRTQGLNSIVLDKNLSNYEMRVTRVYIGDYNFAKPAPGSKPEVKPEPKPEVKPEPKPEVKPEPKPEVKPEPKPEVKPEPKPEVKPEPKPEVKPEPKPEVKPEPKPEVKPEPKPEVKPQPTPTPGEADNGAVNANNFEQEMLTLVNAERAKNGVKPLVMDTKIVEVARLKSKDMIDKNYFSHTSPTYGSPFDMMKSFGITYKTAGENIAGNQSVQRAHQALMNSEGHRKNILNPNFTHIGIGIVEGGPYGLMFTQMFVGR